MKGIIFYLINFIKKPDNTILEIINNYGYLTYLIISIIITCETGIIFLAIIMPIMPGDALIFSLGLVSSIPNQKIIQIQFIIPILILSALIGDNINYFIGKKFGKYIINKKRFFIKPDTINKGVYFFKKNGIKTIIISRFMPVIRTITPFICGVINIKYRTFIIYSIISSLIWIIPISIIGYKLGNIQIVKNNVEICIILIIIISNIPTIYKILLNKKNIENNKTRIDR